MWIAGQQETLCDHPRDDTLGTLIMKTKSPLDLLTYVKRVASWHERLGGFLKERLSEISGPPNRLWSAAIELPKDLSEELFPLVNNTPPDKANESLLEGLYERFQGLDDIQILLEASYRTAWLGSGEKVVKISVKPVLPQPHRNVWSWSMETIDNAISTEGKAAPASDPSIHQNPTTATPPDQSPDDPEIAEMVLIPPPSPREAADSSLSGSVRYLVYRH